MSESKNFYNDNSSLLEILEDERKRISLNLHDNVQNKLILLRDKYATKNKDLFQEIQSIIDELRAVTQQLIPKNLQEMNLVDFLNIYETSLNQIYGKDFKIDFRTNVNIKIEKSIEIVLFNIIQECVSNVVKHAKDTPVLLIRYKIHDNMLQLIVQDFGQGFDIENTDIENSLGLRSIKTRSESINATLKITSDKLGGTKIKVSLPLDACLEDADEVFTENEAHNYNSRQDMTILLVDNQIEYLNYLSGVIRKSYPNAVIHTALSAELAKEKIEKIGKEKIDVIITDITMPNMSGIQFIEDLKKEGTDKKCKIIVYSINDNPAYIFKIAQKMNIKYYVWKESAFENDKHPIIKALEETQQYYTPEIEKINATFKLKKFDEEKDGLYRKMFKQYIELLREGKPKNEIWESLHKDNAYMEPNSIKKYIQRYKNNLGIFDEEQTTYILKKLAKDFGL